MLKQRSGHRPLGRAPPAPFLGTGMLIWTGFCHFPRFFLKPLSDTVNKMAGAKLTNQDTIAPWVPRNLCIVFLVPGYRALARALSVNRALLTHTRSAARFTMQWQRISTVLADLCRSSRLIPAFKLLLLELSFHCSVPGSFVASSLVSPLESSALQF